MHRTLRLAQAVVLSLLVLPCLNANAAVTVGQVAASTNEACDGVSNNFVQATSAPGSPSFTIPANGTITSWSHNSRGIGGSQLKLKVFRYVSGTTWRSVGQSEFRSVAAVGSHPFPTSIAVRKGDLLGLATAANADTAPPSCFDPNGKAGDREWARNGDLMTGQPGTFPAGPFPVRLNVSAVLVPTPTGGGGGGGAADTTKPGAKVGGRKTQNLLKAKSLTLTLRPTENATVTGRASLRVSGRTLRTKRVKRSLKAGRRTTVKLKLSSRNLRRVRRALRRGKRLKAKVRLTLTDAAGNKKPVKRTIKVRAPKR